ncbi:MAG: 3-deoxy-D-manno-octulosonic acid transferase [Pseudomonadota bacterium]
MKDPFLLRLYLRFGQNATGLAHRMLRKRLAKGKEDPERVNERRGEPGLARPAGRLIWFHAASVGESLSLLEVIRRLGTRDPGLSFLLTTGTRTSAQILAARMPPRTLHQFVPMDVGPFVTRFLDHWHPDLAVWTESELWPALITETSAREIPMVLVNGRMSERSIRNWRRFSSVARAILSRFDAVQVQDDMTAAAFRDFGFDPVKIAVTGTLKEGSPPPPCDEEDRQTLSEAIGGRPVWLAASTHPGEEEVMIDAFKIAAKSAHNLLLILAPRHPDRRDTLVDLISASGCRFSCRGAGEAIGKDTQIYLADTLGEMGLWYRLAPVSFVGGSLVDMGGHNPFEPAALGSAIIHGPHVQNFQDIYGRLAAAGAAIQVINAVELSEAVLRLIQPDNSAPLAYAAWELCSAGADVTDRALAVILDHLPACPEAQTAASTG